MKGVVFTEFLEMVEDSFGFDVADNIIENADLPSGGAYTAVGTYHHSEMVQLVVNLSEETKTPVPKLLHAYGNHLFGQFVAGYGHFFDGITDTYAFMHGIHNHIHVEVRKLYPDSELPEFQHEIVNDKFMTLTYRSERGLADLAEGLLRGCFEHYGESVQIEKRDDSDGQGKLVRFELRRI